MVPSTSPLRFACGPNDSTFSGAVDLIRSLLLSVLLVMGTVVSGVSVAAQARVGTWNAMRLGNGEQKSYEAMAAIAANLDIFALQEVMNSEGVESLQAALEKRTGEKWSVLSSSPVGSRSYKEMYSFVYRDSAVEYLDGAVSYLDRSNIFIREPFSATFKSKLDGGIFSLATVHIVYGASPAVRIPELQELGNFWTWLEQIYPGQPIILMGDFNMRPDDPAFESLRRHAMPLVTDGASTLSTTDKKFANLYDNVFVNARARALISGVGIVNFPAMLGWDHVKARQHVSDHAPIFFQMGKAQLPAAVQMVYPQGPTQKVRQVPNAVAANDSVFTREVTHAVGGQASVPQAGSVHGNRNSLIYHLASGCPSYDKISPKNLVVFSSEADAISQSYRKAGNCH